MIKLQHKRQQNGKNATLSAIPTILMGASFLCISIVSFRIFIVHLASIDLTTRRSLRFDSDELFLKEFIGQPSFRGKNITSDDSFDERSNAIQPISNSEKNTIRRGALIHVGKTAGSTVSVLLRNGCHQFVKRPCKVIPTDQESMASKLISDYYHVPDFFKLWNSSLQHDFYVVSTRDPFDRTISAFTYEHFQNIIARGEKIDQWKLKTGAFDCFPSLETFAQFLGPDNPKNYDFTYSPKTTDLTNVSCQDLARASMFSQIRIYDHLFFSYHQIKSFLLQQTNVKRQQQVFYAIRQENLWEDWKVINQQYLKQSNDVFIPHKAAVRRNITDIDLPVSRDISDTGKRYLCNALAEEYEAYFWFLVHAKNLKKSDINDALFYAKQNCPNLQLDPTKLAMIS